MENEERSGGRASSAHALLGPFSTGRMRPHRIAQFCTMRLHAAASVENAPRGALLAAHAVASDREDAQQQLAQPLKTLSEELELVAAAATTVPLAAALTPDFYASYLLIVLLAKKMNDARFLWKRIARRTPRRSRAVWEIGKALWQPATREGTAELLSLAYSTISVSDAALGLARHEDAMQYCSSLNWEVNAADQMILPEHGGSASQNTSDAESTVSTRSSKSSKNNSSSSSWKQKRRRLKTERLSSTTMAIGTSVISKSSPSRADRGDDLAVTNPIEQKACDAFLLKVNQIASNTASIEAVTVEKKSVAAGVKKGAPCHAERLVKYNQAQSIEKDRDDKTTLVGMEKLDKHHAPELGIADFGESEEQRRLRRHTPLGAEKYEVGATYTFDNLALGNKASDYTSFYADVLYTAEQFVSFGPQAEIKEYCTLLSYHIHRRRQSCVGAQGRLHQQPNALPPFLAYSGSSNVTASVVYVYSTTLYEYVLMLNTYSR
ncbi:hypothetical protein PHYSODRAFT_342800 [Phytophthora sojae]|uniref:phosphopyruvate hydratase n=1 Tax=Phytophthora sojae (strain P6497) TaxID=1094619 RepID=G5AHN0_PHYSP|nr:hypothetical protein PHYSODRAFT_342800 [Phytophthora sojae]EGZ04951.1 hypothetical protein PHYSODRAFT_342800 [Phytophthora sojae]|eukprot:XP_009539581.1 hypothetical protein PHYSODRAFT_342800 [Phytophthora sojae]